MGEQPITNALTIDVEDYFQVSAFAPHIPRTDWGNRECRVEANVDRILALLDDAGARATFFTLGWIAERYPQVVRRIVDNGHTVQVALDAGSLTVTGKTYEFVQFHFHKPSEEKINGQGFDMVAHLVHRADDGKLAVVAVLLERGAENPFIQTLWNNLPLERQQEVRVAASLDLNALLPANRNYFTYMGSLTTPPCSEGVLWLVMKQPVAVSPDQIAVFSRLYPRNARPIQPVAGRLIKEGR